MSVFREAYERIKYATNCRTQVEIAKVLDIRQSSISDAKRRDSVPAEWIMKLFEKFGLNPDWIKQGIGPMYLRNEEGYGPIDAPAGLAEDPAHYGDDMAKNVMVSIHGMSCKFKASEGTPALPQVGKISLPASFAKAGTTVLRMEAPNMEPLILRGAHVGVDTQNTIPSSGSVYAIYSPHEGVILRKLFLDAAADQYILQSESDTYPEERIKAQSLSSRIMGRVDWILQNI